MCRIWVWNVWSIMNDEKLRNVLQTMEDNKVDIGCITETWFDTNKGKFTGIIKEAGYDISHSHRENKRGGGTAIIYKEKLNVKLGQASSSKYSSFEYTYVFLKDIKLKILLLCVYRKQEIPCSTFCSEFETFFDELSGTTDVQIVVGDFNTWVEEESNKDANMILTLMSAYGMSQIVQGPTHRNGHTLDQVYTNEMQIAMNHNVHNGTYGVTTDHFPCLLQIPFGREKETFEMKEVRPLKKIDMERFTRDIKTLVNNIGNLQGDFESTYINYKTAAEKLLEEHCPIETRRVKNQKKVAWMDEEFKKERAKRRRLEKTWKRSQKKEDHQQYVDQRNICVKLSIQKQESFYKELINKSSNKQKTLFEVVDKVLDKKDPRVLPTHTDPVQLANEFNEYYISKIDKLRESIPETKDDSIVEVTRFTGEKMIRFEPTTVEEIKEIIQESGLKASAEDPLPMGILHSVKEELYPVLVQLVNLSLAEGSMEGIKSSVIDPLLKKLGLDMEVKKNYRPVNNLVSLSKLIERVVKKRIDGHMQCNNLHNKRAFGYKKHHSTETMMLGMVNDVLTGFDEDKATVMVFLDLSAAFDTIDISKLITILEEEIGLGGTALQWCKSFLMNRTQRVKIKGQYSEKLEVKYGSVQGSVLGPKFFNIYVRSQPKVFLNSGFETSSFADDSNGSKTFSIKFQYNVLKNDVATCINNVVAWMNSMYLKINPDKTEIILFHPHEMRNKVVIQGTMIGKDCIRFSKEVKNVGVWLDRHLNMNKHIDQIVAQCYKWLRDIGRIRNLISQEHTEMLVHSVVSSRLDYCNSLLMNINKSNLYKLQKVQNAAARLVVRRRKHESISGVIRKLHWLRVESRIIFKILLLVHKVVIGHCSANLQIKYKTHCCRPQEHLMLETKHANSKYGQRTFDYVGPRLWNALPVHIRSEEDVEKFKGLLKTLLFDGTDDLKKCAFKYN